MTNREEQKAKYLLIPGLRNSGPDHWQSIWEAQYPERFRRVMQDNWGAPDNEAWTNRIQEEVEKSDIADIILIGHSVGCAAIVNWYHRFGGAIRGAMLVAPSDVDRADYPSYITGFAPVKLQPLPFPSIVVASDDDHVVTLERARYFANCWKSRLFVLEKAGHVDGKNGYGSWPEGLNYLEELTSGKYFATF